MYVMIELLQQRAGTSTDAELYVWRTEVTRIRRLDAAIIGRLSGRSVMNEADLHERVCLADLELDVIAAEFRARRAA